MLTEADMMRIMAARYSLTESIADEFIDNEVPDIHDEDVSSNYDMIEMNDLIE